MKILALEPYYGGSHRAFLDGWIKHSRHDWTLLTLPASKWKWRMRHSAVTLADETDQLVKNGGIWDLVFCSDMLNLAEYKGLVDRSVRELPAVAYFHENQLTYPARFGDQRDDHFPMTNLTTSLAADKIWFNSNFHRCEFLEALPAFLNKMPDYRMPELVDRIKAKSLVMPPGIESLPPRPEREDSPIHILWAARWEHDKNPEVFFEALYILKKQKIPFRLSVIGQQFRKIPDVFNRAKSDFHDEIINWGYRETRAEYISVLQQADVIVSTAWHEFFGITVLEAIAAGAWPLLPKRLSYPEIIGDTVKNNACFYDDSVSQLADRLNTYNLCPEKSTVLNEIVRPYFWASRAPRLDNALDGMSCT